MKLSLFAYDMILYIENPKFCTKILLEPISKLRKIAGYKINILKSVAFLLYTNNEMSEKVKKFHLRSHQNSKITRNKPKQGSERPIF